MYTGCFGIFEIFFCLAIAKQELGLSLCVPNSTYFYLSVTFGKCFWRIIRYKEIYVLRYFTNDPVIFQIKRLKSECLMDFYKTLEV